MITHKALKGVGVILDSNMLDRQSQTLRVVLRYCLPKWIFFFLSFFLFGTWKAFDKYVRTSLMCANKKKKKKACDAAA